MPAAAEKDPSAVNISAVFIDPVWPWPPVISTLPSGRPPAQAPLLAAAMLPFAIHIPVASGDWKPYMSELRTPKVAITVEKSLLGRNIRKTLLAHFSFDR